MYTKGRHQVVITHDTDHYHIDKDQEAYRRKRFRLRCMFWGFIVFLSILVITLLYSLCCNNSCEKSSSLEAGGSSLEAGGSSLEAGGSSLEAGGSSLDVGGSSLDVGGSSLDVGGSSLDMDAMDAMYTGNSFDDMFDPRRQSGLYE